MKENIAHIIGTVILAIIIFPLRAVLFFLGWIAIYVAEAKNNTEDLDYLALGKQTCHNEQHGDVHTSLSLLPSSNPYDIRIMDWRLR